MIREAEVAIIGAGMAGASLAAEISPYASVLLLEGESQPGYHATGRSAAFWSETYGGPLIQPLTTASGPFLADPSADFWSRSFLSSRGAIHLAGKEGSAALAALDEEFRGTSIDLKRLDKGALAAAIPGLRGEWMFGLFEASCADIDVAGLHSAYLKQARSNGASLVPGTRVEGVQRKPSGWLLETPKGRFECALLVNAAGAWADEVAKLAGEDPLGIQPYRRTIVQLRVHPPASAHLPLVVDALGRFYFKPEAGGRLWVSPHDETPCPPCDSAAEEIDIALAIDRLQRVVDWRIERVEHSWAGLRSFAPDRLPVYGFSSARRDFFWCAGQGGFGIQTAPAAAKLAASLLLGLTPDPMVSAIDPAPYLAARFTN